MSCQLALVGCGRRDCRSLTESRKSFSQSTLARCKDKDLLLFSQKSESILLVALIGTSI